jgi:hypothetical protein
MLAFITQFSSPTTAAFPAGIGICIVHNITLGLMLHDESIHASVQLCDELIIEFIHRSQKPKDKPMTQTHLTHAV